MTTPNPKQECCEKCKHEEGGYMTPFIRSCRNIDCTCHTPTPEILFCDRQDGSKGKECKCTCHQEDYPLPSDFPTPKPEGWEGNLFVSEKGILRTKTSVIDGHQYWKNAGIEDIRSIVTSSRSDLIERVRKEIMSLPTEIEDYDPEEADIIIKLSSRVDFARHIAGRREFKVQILGILSDLLTELQKEI